MVWRASRESQLFKSKQQHQINAHEFRKTQRGRRMDRIRSFHSNRTKTVTKHRNAEPGEDSTHVR